MGEEGRAGGLLVYRSILPREYLSSLCVAAAAAAGVGESKLLTLSRESRLVKAGALVEIP